MELQSRRIGTLEEGYDRHNAFLFGRFDEKTNAWMPGFAERLADAVVDIGEIRATISNFTTWVQTGLSRAAIAVLGFIVSATGGVLWFTLTHWDKVQGIFK